MKYAIAVVLIVLLVIFVLPLRGKWWVNDKYIYGVRSMGEINLALNDGALYCTGKKLSIYKHWRIKRIGMLNGRVK